MKKFSFEDFLLVIFVGLPLLLMFVLIFYFIGNLITN
ncbi:hypothetical protein UFOVP615_32 [uncultured Caudovirales phage]|uniref:Uncharacterized protein n=1 Tax=uncultured Caudovirales phage TaxID=2100421 RepID=A0A6J5N6J4_9CAUD|nr:hypothetical protein UFOVP615_32 [uncultured Caudovirales phage]